MIEKYSKEEIVCAIRKFRKYDSKIEHELVQIIREQKQGGIDKKISAAHKEWQKALGEYLEYRTEIKEKYGKINISVMKSFEYEKLIRLYEASCEAEKKEKLLLKEANTNI